MKNFYRRFAALFCLFVFVFGASAQPAAPVPVYDMEWAKTVAPLPNAVDLIRDAWNTRVGDKWKSNGGPGTYDIPAHSIVVAVGDMETGNAAAFEQLASNVWVTGEGGRFGATSSFFAFQLDGAPTGSLVNRPMSIDGLMSYLSVETSYDRIIALLDIEWSGNPFVINRWGTSAPTELLSSDQIAALETAGLPLVAVNQILPGNVVVWGQLAPGETHFGLVELSQNVYLTTCMGGKFVSLSGFRAMQLPPLAAESVIPDTEGCGGLYRPIDLEDIRSATPLEGAGGG